jgi:hypothetical protein
VLLRNSGGPQSIFRKSGSRFSAENATKERAFSGKVDPGFPQKMRPKNESRARFRFNLIGTRSSHHGTG